MINVILFYEEKDDIKKVIAITLAEKEAIRDKYPNVHIARTMKQDSKRHHYYMVEASAPMRYLNSMRGFETQKKNRKDV